METYKIVPKMAIEDIDDQRKFKIGFLLFEFFVLNVQWNEKS